MTDLRTSVNRINGPMARYPGVAKSMPLVLLSCQLLLSGPLQAAESGEDCAARDNLFDQISCYADQAKKSGDHTVCQKAAHNGVRYQCTAIYAEHIQSPELCRSIPRTDEELSALVDVCLSDVALVLNDPQLCTDLQEPGLKDSCYFKIARERDEKALCERIEDEGMKSMCTGEPVWVDEGNNEQ